MLRVLIPVILTLPFVELYILVQMASYWGFLETLAVVIGTGIIGAFLIRKEGIYILRKARTSVTAGEASRNLLDGLLLALSAVLLLTPGVITDVIGFVVVFRPVRERLAVKLSQRIQSSGRVQTIRL